MAKKSQRLSPTQNVIKKLFAYSGNQCAMPDCTEVIVDKSGAMLGKVAHIHAAEPGGARYNEDMTDEERRAFENLFIVCGKHHDIIDYKKDENDYPAPLLQKYKKQHEGRFQKAERQLLKQFVDTTQITQPIYPKNLNALAEATKDPNLDEDDLRGVHDFIDKLKELPLEDRDFALKLAERMKRRSVKWLPPDDVMGAFGLSQYELIHRMKLLEHHSIGSIEEAGEDEYAVQLDERERAGNPWIEILEFCEATGHTTDELVHDLNFGLYSDE